MGMFREWTDRHVTALGEREPLGLWIMRQSGLDRAHYAEVEAQHKRDIASMDNTLAYWKRQADDARLDVFNKSKVNEVLLKERDEARAEAVRRIVELTKANDAAHADSDYFKKEAKANAFSLNEARESSERFQRRNIVQAETIGFLQKQNDSLRGQLNAAEQEIKIVRARPAQDESLRHAR